uniref:Uncharacterized protein n=1 Tax=Romanomermis culicivorax TaxID=13658 RepID=A0A915KKU5_ROMCU
MNETNRPKWKTTRYHSCIRTVLTKIFAAQIYCCCPTPCCWPC